MKGVLARCFCSGLAAYAAVLAPGAGLEPATSRVGDGRTVQLCYPGKRGWMIWYERRDSNPQIPEPESGAYADSATLALFGGG